MSEPRLIDANALKTRINNVPMHGDTDVFYEIMSELVSVVAAATTIDAVAVVRCKDCALRGTCDCPPWYANEWGIGQDVPGDNDFCSRGERRQG